jgi:hypothetical protein
LGRNNLKWTFGSVKRFDSSTSHTDTF